MAIEKVVIGAVTLYCGDCREILPTLARLDTLITDPPYGMEFKSNYRIEKHLEIEGDDSIEHLLYMCSIKADHSKYIFCRWDNISKVPKPKSCITWIKNNWSMGDLRHEHARQTEIALFYPGERHDFPSGRPADVVNSARTGNEWHPTEKPVTLMSWFVRNTRGHVVAPYMGSGTTGVACVQMGRQFTGIERERKYFDIACRRIEQAQAQGQLIPHEVAKPEQAGLPL